MKGLFGLGLFGNDDDDLKNETSESQQDGMTNQNDQSLQDNMADLSGQSQQINMTSQSDQSQGTNQTYGTNQNDQTNTTADSATIQLRQEELDINKSRVPTGEVILSKEVIEEQKNVEVPIVHEEVVIERKSLNNEDCSSPITSGETIHIPVTEEQVQVGKHTVVTGEVSAYKREVEQTQQVNETVRREEARIDRTGNAALVENENDQNLK
jgi:uncharacterized protein (TIGR02271 family)